MKHAKVKSLIIVVGLLLVFTLGGVALSLGQDSLTVGSISALGWHPSQPARAPLDDYTLHVGLIAENGNVPAFHARVSQGILPPDEPLIRRGLVAVSDSTIARKVSLHLLDSVLLI